MSTENKTFSFEDHFSKHSQQYAQYRPQYPDEIYALSRLHCARTFPSLGLWYR